MYFLSTRYFPIFQRCYSQQGDTHQILCKGEEKSIAAWKFTAKWGVALVHFTRFDEKEDYAQSKSSHFRAHVEETAVMKSLLYVKHHGQGNTFKV